MPSPDAVAQADAALAAVMAHLPPEEQAIVAGAQFVVADEPTPAQWGDFPPDGWLLGLYTAPPATVTVFEQEALKAAAAGKIPPNPIPDIVRHETGHILGYMHDDPAGSQNMHCGCLPAGAGVPCDCGALYVRG